MNDKKQIIAGGIYLVVDPSLPRDLLYSKIVSALSGGVDLLQIWNHWPKDVDKLSIIKSICAIASPYKVPVIINGQNELLNKIDLDGIHFDEIPDNFNELRKKTKKPFFTGITCGNDFSKIEWAITNKLDYISFSPLFPSASLNTFELVNKEIIQRARAATSMPIFLSGGIDLKNINKLKDTPFDGVAISSGIMNSSSPKLAAQLYKRILDKTTNNNR